MKKILFVVILTVFVLSACGTPATPVPVPTNTPVPLPTETPIPPTATLVPMLTDGTDIWRIEKVILKKTLTVNNQTIDAGTGNVYLQVEFECVTGKMPPFPAQAGGGPDYTKIYVVDGSGQNHIAEQFGVTFSGSSFDNCSSFFLRFEPIPQESNDFTLYFADLTPVKLGQ